MLKKEFKDSAIILSWPDATIRGDEAWMMFFKKIGIVLVEHSTGRLFFYDFGRYIAPRGYGRARSANSDPLLEINLLAQFENNTISNLQEIIQHFESLKESMYGQGKVYFSVVRDLDFNKAKAYADSWVDIGTYPYGAVARNNNNCSRFITRILMESSERFHFWHKINFPETIKASPMSNLVNSVPDKMIYSYTENEGLRKFKMTRWASFWFLLKKLQDNVSSKKAVLLPDDSSPGAMTVQNKPASVPANANYLGGVGDGAWFSVEPRSDRLFSITRFTTSGIKEYSIIAESAIVLEINQPLQVTYDSHFMVTHVIQNNKKHRLEHLKRTEKIHLSEPAQIEEYIN
jgi:hypothetical protein